MPERLLLVGCGGHASVLLDIAAACGLLPAVAGCVDREDAGAASFRGLPVLGTDAEIPRLAAAGPLRLVLGVGAMKDMAGRAATIRRLDALGLPYATLVHPTAVVSSSARIGEGCAVMPAAVVNADADVGRLAILNSGCVVEHGCRVGANALVGPRAVLAGGACVGADTLVGAGAVVLPGVRVGAGCVVAAGAVVTADVPDGVRVAGVPARRMDREGKG